MEKLKAELDKPINRLEQAPDFRDQLEDLVSEYPFNECEVQAVDIKDAIILAYKRQHNLN
jgi:hypothetical protein